MISSERNVPKAPEFRAQPQVAVAVAPVVSANVYTIGGTRVEFPCVPYPSQVSLMNAIMSGLNGKEHCLLESPTGSGKSLALLCSTLAWQKHQYEKLMNEERSPGEDEKSCKGSATPQTPLSCANTCACFCHAAPTSQAPPGAAPSAGEPGSRSPYFGSSPRFPAAAVGSAGSPATPAVTLAVTSDVATAGSPLASPYFVSASPGMSRSGKRGSPADDDDDFQVEKRRIKTSLSKALVQMRRGVPKGVHFDDDSGPSGDGGGARGGAGGAGGPIPLATLNKRNGQTPAWNPAGITPSAAACCSCRSLPPAGIAAAAPGSDGCCGDAYAPDGKPGGRKPTRPPVIFFGTRTHRQITQVVHELRRTAYASTRMAVLSSREHTCVHPVVSGSPNGRNEACRELLDNKDGISCSFYRNVYKLGSQAALPGLGLASAWDVEDLVRVGRRIGACPYFSARELMADADIIFCPYNYLIDPQIRQSMEITVRDQVVVLDEAHNMEDCSRESASASMPQEALRRARDEAGSLAAAGVRSPEHTRLQAVCISLDRWMTECTGLLKSHEFESDCHKLGGREMLTILHSWGVTPHTFPELKRSLAHVLEKEEMVAGGGRAVSVPVPVVSAPSQMLLTSLFLVLDFMFRDGSRFVDDYRVVLLRTMAWSAPEPDVPDSAGFIARPRPGSRSRHKRQQLTVNFWCQNPAVAFTDLSAHARTIILTSGTLSPMASFSSELGVSFTIQREATHVVNPSQVWVGTVGLGPGGRELCATFRHTETLVFQDELGQLLLSVCRTVPRGVLCFLPSYKILQRLSERWQSTGLWASLEEHKLVMCEPQRGERAVFDRLLHQYYGAVHADGARDGALLLAVCRGKVSEGLDFADDNARMVITVGIPYPNTRDLQVKLKRDYNDLHTRSRGLLSGSRWYEVQAFRALNQALGRCIRHRHDWGALLLVDTRFGNSPAKYTEGLSKWLRQKVQHYADFPSSLRSLSAFTRACQATATLATPTTPTTPADPGKAALEQPAAADEPAALFHAPFRRGSGKAASGEEAPALPGWGRPGVASVPPVPPPAEAGTPCWRRRREQGSGRRRRRGIGSIARFLSPHSAWSRARGGDAGGDAGWDAGVTGSGTVAGAVVTTSGVTPASAVTGTAATSVAKPAAGVALTGVSTAVTVGCCGGAGGPGVTLTGTTGTTTTTDAASVAANVTPSTGVTATTAAAGVTPTARSTATAVTATTTATASSAAEVPSAAAATAAVALPASPSRDSGDERSRCYTPELFESEWDVSGLEENSVTTAAAATAAVATLTETSAAEDRVGWSEDESEPECSLLTSPSTGDGGPCRRVRLSKTRQRRERGTRGTPGAPTAPGAVEGGGGRWRF